MNRTTLRALIALVIVMGVMIVAGLAGLVTLILTRSLVSAPSLRIITLDEPPAARITGVSLSGGVLAVGLSGGGPERVLLIDSRSGRLLGRILLSGPATGGR